MNNQFSDKILIIVSFLSIYIIWGITYLAIAIGLVSFPPFIMAAIRFLMAGAILVGFVLIKGEGFPSLKSLSQNFVFGAITLVGGQGLLIWSEQHIASGYASILIATLPLWFVLLDRMHWRLYFSKPWIVLGLIVGFGGIILLFREQLQATSENSNLKLIASIAVLTGGICWVAGTLWYKAKQVKGSMYANLGWQLVSASVLCLIIGLLKGEWMEMSTQTISIDSWVAVIFLAVFGSVVALIAYTYLLATVPSALVGTYAYINPIIAVFVGWFYANENISSMQLMGMGVILIGALMINLNKSK